MTPLAARSGKPFMTFGTLIGFGPRVDVHVTLIGLLPHKGFGTEGALEVRGAGMGGNMTDHVVSMYAGIHAVRAAPLLLMVQPVRI